jgi:hypothetical protein
LPRLDASFSELTVYLHLRRSVKLELFDSTLAPSHKPPVLDNKSPAKS